MPNTPQEQFEELVRCAEKYIRSPQKSKASTVMRWRNKTQHWLKANAANTSLSVRFIITKTPADDGYDERAGITRGSVIGVQNGLKILQEAREILPLLASSRPVLQSKNLRKVFIVHGHDELLKESVARCVTKLGLEPVILHEQPNHGRTIIEKFIDHSDVAYAVVLLSPDDHGGPAKDSPESLKPRARQNVIFELGYFIGKLGRDRVAAIHRHGVEIPSDYYGVLFIDFDDSHAWQLSLAKEMRDAKIKVNLNNL